MAGLDESEHSKLFHLGVSQSIVDTLLVVHGVGRYVPWFRQLRTLVSKLYTYLTLWTDVNPLLQALYLEQFRGSRL